MPKKAVFLYFLAALIGAALFIFFTFPRNASQFWPSKNQDRHLPPLQQSAAPEKSGPATTEPAAKPTGVTLRVMTWASGDKLNALQAEVDAFSRRTGNQVALSVSSNEADYRRDLAAAVSTPDAPDLCQISSRDLSGLDPAELSPLEPPKAVPFRGGLDAFTEQKTLVAWPNEVSVEVLYYNPHYFDQAGLAYPGPHWTYDILEAISRALAAQKLHDASGQPVFALELPVGFAFWNTLCAEAGVPVLDAKGWHFGELNAEISHEHALDTLNNYYHTLNVVAPLPKKNQTSGSYFQQGRAALWFGTTGDVEQLGALPWAQAPLPKDLGRAGQATYLGWAVLKKSTHRTEAEELGQILATKIWHAGWNTPILPASEDGLTPEQITQATALADSFIVRETPETAAVITKMDKLLFDFAQSPHPPEVHDLYLQLQAIAPPATK